MREARIKIPKLAIAIAIIFIAVIATIVIIKSHPTEFPISSLERLTIEERTEKIINYLEEIDSNAKSTETNNPDINSIPLDQYIAYALEYSYNENDQPELSAKKIKKFLESTFDISFKTADINGVGISPLLLDKNVNHDPVSQIYTLNPSTDKRIIADIPVTKYFLKEIHTNEDQTIYTATYDKYTAKSPYDILPHANGEGVRDYLDGKGKIKSLKDSITKSAAEKLGDPVKQTTIEFVLKDKKLLIKSIK